MTIDYEKIKHLVTLVEQNQLAELAVEENDLSITIKAERSVSIPAPASAAQASVHVEVQPCENTTILAAQTEELILPAETPSEHLVEIKSPMVGVFYRCPSPDSPPYVEIGDEVELGQTIGLIEAMKVFSEVPSEAAGRVVAAPVGNAKLVQQGDLLAIIDTSPIE